MGLESRDYLRDDDRTGGGMRAPARPGSMTKQIVIVTALVFVAQVLIRVGPDRRSLVTYWLQMDARIWTGQVWRFVTYALCHDTRMFAHILFNMIVLWWTGQAVEAILGPREFLRFYVAAAVTAAVAYIGLGLVLGNAMGAMIGASGAVMAAFAYFATTYPRAQVYIFGILPVEARWLLVAYVALDMYPVLLEFGGQNPAGNVAHAAHLGGLAFGLWYKFSGTNIGRWFHWPAAGERRRTNPNVKLYEPTRRELDERVDELLDKIRREGEGSLSDKEREFLRNASRQYRDR